jgi:predicted O-methyltransferase YrrM
LDSGVKSSDVVLEFGSGRSTAWLAERAKQVISVEHDAEWHGKVTADLAKLGLTNVQQHLCAGDEYLSIFSQLGPESVDLVLDDGMQRDRVALECVSRLVPGGLLVIDDAARYLPRDVEGGRRSVSPTRNRSYASDEWHAFGERTRAWRRFWFSNGVTDTVIFLKATLSHVDSFVAPGPHALDGA